MIRKNIRLRKEYLLNKAKDIQLRATADKKRKLKAALDSDKPIPTELRPEGEKLLNELELDDNNTIVPRTTELIRVGGGFDGIYQLEETLERDFS